MTCVSALIPNWNGAALLSALLDSCASQSLPFFEILVIDNGSSDNSVQIAEQHGARVLRLDQNLGFAHAVNAGIRASTGDWIAILNNDVQLNSEWLARLLQRVEKSEASFATGKLLRATAPTRIDGTWDAICRGGCAWRCGQGRADGPAWSDAKEIALAPLTAALIRRDVFETVGLLDERFESYLEDIDFGLRCSNHQLSGIYVPDAIAYHIGSATLGAWNADTVRRVARNQLFLVAKHYPQRWFWHYGWHVFIAQTLWGAVAARHGAGVAFLRGKIEGLRRFREFRRDRDANETCADFLRRSERELHTLQRQAGFDWYWRIYFALT